MCLVSSPISSDDDGCPRNGDGGDDDVWCLHGRLMTQNGHAPVELGMEDRSLEYGQLLLQPNHEGSHENAFSIVPSNWIKYLTNILLHIKLLELK